MEKSSLEFLPKLCTKELRCIRKWHVKSTTRNTNVCLLGILGGETNNKEEEGIWKIKRKEHFLEVKKDTNFQVKFIVLFLFPRLSLRMLHVLIIPHNMVVIWLSCDRHRSTKR